MFHHALNIGQCILSSWLKKIGYECMVMEQCQSVKQTMLLTDVNIVNELISWRAAVKYKIRKSLIDGK